MTQKNYDPAVDFARIVACFAVIMIHTAGSEFEMFESNGWASNFYNALSRFAVPLFFMLTGANLIRRQEPVAYFFKRRFLRVIPTLIFWSIANLIAFFPNEILTRIPLILKGPVAAHLWFMYSIIVVYAAVPWLCSVYSVTTRKERWILILPWVFTISTWPLVCIWFMPQYDLTVLNTLYRAFADIGYAFLGAICYEEYEEYHPSKLRRNIVGFVSSGMLIMLFSMWLTTLPQPFGFHYYVYASPFVFFSTVFVFWLLLGTRPYLYPYSPKLRYLADCTMGIYGFHMMPLLFLVIPYAFPRPIGSFWWSVPASTVAVFLFSLLVIAPLRKIPYFHRFV